MSGSAKVTIQEKDFSIAVIGNHSSGAATVGPYTWGPVLDPQKINFGTRDFAIRYGKANDNNYIQHLITKDHLRTNSDVWVNRVAGYLARNATSIGLGIRVDNEDEYRRMKDLGAFNAIPFMGRYPGSLANDLTIEIVKKDTYDSWEYKDAFTEELDENTFHVAVIDTKGKLTNNGARKQQEVLMVASKEPSYTQSTLQEELLTVDTTTPAWSSYRQEVVAIQIKGIVNKDTKISILGVSEIELKVNDTPNETAFKIKQSLIKSKLFSNVQLGMDGNLTATFLQSGPQMNQSDLDLDGIIVEYKVLLEGYQSIEFPYMGESVEYKYDIYNPNVNHANGIAIALAESLSNNDFAFIASAIPIGNKVEVLRNTPGPANKLRGMNLQGVLITNTISVPGILKSSITIDGQFINLYLDTIDYANSIASQVAAVLGTHEKYESVVANGSAIYVNYKEIGYHKPISSVQESNITITAAPSIPGFKGEMIEKYEALSDVHGDKKTNGMPKYYIDVINNNSNYIWIGEDVQVDCSCSYVLKGGVDDYDNARQYLGIQQFKSKEKYQLRMIFVHSDEIYDTKTAIQLAKTRMDMVAYVSIPDYVVFSNPFERAVKATEWRRYVLNENNSYFFLDQGWGEFFDVDNDKFRWIPMCGGTAAIVSRLFSKDEWHKSPGNIDRGSYGPYRKIAWSPDEDERDLLYRYQINPIVNLDSSIVLWGDKTGYSKPSAFNRINVRNTFIVLEDDIGKLARYFLFELHDIIAYRKFENAVEPYLRRRIAEGRIEDATWIGDERVNDEQVKVENRMVGVVLAKPKYSINEVNLIFGAVRPDLKFEEIEVLQ
jgi:hypothetical protein